MSQPASDPIDPVAVDAAAIGASLLLADLHEAVAEATAQLAALAASATPMAAPPRPLAGPAPVGEPAANASEAWPHTAAPSAGPLAPAFPVAEQPSGRDAPMAPGVAALPPALPVAPGQPADVTVAVAPTIPDLVHPAAPSGGWTQAWSSPPPAAAAADLMAPPLPAPASPVTQWPPADDPAGQPWAPAASATGAATMPWSESAWPHAPSSASAWSPSSAQDPGTGSAAGPAALASAAPPPRQDTAPTGGDVFLDGVRVGRWLSDTLAREAGGPAAGGTGFDPRQGPTWPGALQGNGA